MDKASIRDTHLIMNIIVRLWNEGTYFTKIEYALQDAGFSKDDVLTILSKVDTVLSDSSMLVHPESTFKRYIKRVPNNATEMVAVPSLP